jgi:hypothetical protein
VKEALDRPDKDLWQQAIDEDMDALQKNCAYSDEMLPPGVPHLCPSNLSTTSKDMMKAT